MTTTFPSIFSGFVAVIGTIFAIGALGINSPILVVLFCAGIAITNGWISINFMDLNEQLR
jgi:hypothetical protein